MKKSTRDRIAHNVVAGIISEHVGAGRTTERIRRRGHRNLDDIGQIEEAVADIGRELGLKGTREDIDAFRKLVRRVAHGR